MMEWRLLYLALLTYFQIEYFNRVEEYTTSQIVLLSLAVIATLVYIKSEILGFN